MNDPFPVIIDRWVSLFTEPLKSATETKLRMEAGLFQSLAGAALQADHQKMAGTVSILLKCSSGFFKSQLVT